MTSFSINFYTDSVVTKVCGNQSSDVNTYILCYYRDHMELKCLTLPSVTLCSTEWKHVEYGLGLEHSVLETIEIDFWHKADEWECFVVT